MKMQIRDISSYDITRLVLEGEAVRNSINSLNETIAQASINVMIKFENNTQQLLTFGYFGLDIIAKYLEDIYNLIPKIIKIATNIEDIFSKGNIALLALIFFGIGAVLFFIMLVLHTEYRICRKKYANRQHERLEMNVSTINF
jgi:hypothetical protein